MPLDCVTKEVVLFENIPTLCSLVVIPFVYLLHITAQQSIGNLVGKLIVG